MGRKGQLCRVIVRGRMNSAWVEFEDGFQAVTSRNALRKARAPIPVLNSEPEEPHPMKRIALAVFSVFAICVLCRVACPAQANPTDPPAAEVTKPAKLTEAAPKPVPSAAKEALFEAMHAHDKAQKQISDINLQFLQVQAQAKQQMDMAQAQEKTSAAAVAKAEDEAYKAAGLERKDYKIDDDAMQFTPVGATPRANKAPAPAPPPRQ